MGNLLRMDLYRLVRSKSLYVCLGIICVFCLFTSFALWYTSSPQFLEAAEAAAEAVEAAGEAEAAGAAEAADGTSTTEEAVNVVTFEESPNEAETIDMSAPLTFQQYLGQLAVSGGGSAFLIAIFFALFIAAEYENGFIKNIFSTRKGRGAYVASKTAIAVIVSFVFLLVAMLVTAAGAAVTGLDITFTFSEFLPWALLVVLANAAYAMIIMFIVLITKSKSAGIVAACAIPTGILALVLFAILSLLPDLSFLFDYTLSAGIKELGAGLSQTLSSSGEVPLSALHIAVVSGAYFAAFTALSFVCIRKKDV